jgi:hypothetical protein
MKKIAHIGFKAAVAKAAAGGATNPAGAIAEAARKASPEAVRKNPRLLKVRRGKREKIAAARAGY